MNRRRYAAIAGRDVLEYTQEPRAAVAAFSAVMEDEAYADQDSLMEAAEKRAKRYKIGAKQGGNRMPPKGFPTAEAEYGDPVNYKYPADAEHARPALGYFNQDGQREKGGYSSAEWAIIGRRLARLISRHLKAKYAYKGGKLAQVREGAEEYGGPGSGHHGHAGRPGSVGGSAAGGGGGGGRSDVPTQSSPGGRAPSGGMIGMNGMFYPVTGRQEMDQLGTAVERINRISARLTELNALIEQDKMDVDKLDWAAIGDLGYIAESLQDTVNFYKSRG